MYIPSLIYVLWVGLSMYMNIYAYVTGQIQKITFRMNSCFNFLFPKRSKKNKKNRDRLTRLRLNFCQERPQTQTRDATHNATDNLVCNKEKDARGKNKNKMFFFTISSLYINGTFIVLDCSYLYFELYATR